MSIAPGWYKDPAEPSTQRYWDGEGWIGDPLPAGATPPSGPPPVSSPPPVFEAPTGAPPVRAEEPAGPPVVPQGVAGPPAGGVPPGWHPPPGAPGPMYPPGTPHPMGYPYAVPLPEPRPHGFELASPGARLGARVIDVLLVLLLNVLGNGLFVYKYLQLMGPYVREAYRRMSVGDMNLPPVPDGADTLLFTIIFVAVAIWFAYEVPMVANSGQTIGKRLFRLKVMRLENRDALGMGRSTRRWLRMGWPTLLWPCYGIGLVLQAMDAVFILIDKPLRQTIHDKIALTVVVRTPATPGPSPEGADT